MLTNLYTIILFFYPKNNCNILFSLRDLDMAEPCLTLIPYHVHVECCQHRYSGKM